MKTTRRRANATPKLATDNSQTRIDRIFTVSKRSATRSETPKEALFKRSKLESPVKRPIDLLTVPSMTSKETLVPLSPLKSLKSPLKKITDQSPLKKMPDFTSPVKKVNLMSPQKTGFLTPLKTPMKKEDYVEPPITPVSKATMLSPRVHASADFELPMKYQRLLDLFENMERVVSIEHRQEKRITFARVQQNVKKNLGKDFTKSHFAQILHVYPTSYNVRLEKPAVQSLYTPSNKPELVIEPNLKDDLVPHWHPKSSMKTPVKTEYVVPLSMISPTKRTKGIIDYVAPPSPLKPLKSPMKTPTKATPKKTLAVLDMREKLEPWRLLSRKLIFRYKLMLRVIDAHDKFLKNLETPDDARSKIRHSIDSGNAHGFHPDFDTQSIEDIPEAELPEPPKEKGTPSSVREFLKTCGVETTPKKKGVTPTNVKSAARRKIMFDEDSSPKPSTATPSKPKGSMSLLERIKAKEQEAKLAAMCTDKEEIERRNRIEYIKSKLLMVICSEYSMKQKSSMELPHLITRLQVSSQMSQTDLTDHIKLLTEVAGDFISWMPFGTRTYIRMIKNDYNTILNHINSKTT